MEENIILNNCVEDNCFKQLEAKLTNKNERERRVERLRRRELFSVTPEKRTEQPNLDSVSVEKMKAEYAELRKLVSDTPELSFLQNRVNNTETAKLDPLSLVGLYRIIARTFKDNAKKDTDSRNAEVSNKKNEEKLAEYEKMLSDKERDIFVASETVKLKEKKLQESLEQYDKLKFDFTKYRERIEADVASTSVKKLKELMLKVLPIVDDFERVMAAVPNNEQNVALYTGAELVLDKFYQILKNIGVELIDAYNKPFDPNLHEALMTEINDSLPEDTVMEVISKGYTLNSKLLRPSIVKVSKHS